MRSACGFNAQFRLLRRHVEQIVGSVAGHRVAIERNRAGLPGRAGIPPDVTSDGFPPLIQYSALSRISPPTRIEVSVPGIRNERGKLPPVICTLTGPRPVSPMPYGFPGPWACASWSMRRWRNLLIGPQIGQFVGPSSGLRRYQRHRGGKAAERRPGPHLSVFWSLLPPTVRSCTKPREEHAFLSTNDIARGAAIRSVGLFAP